MVRKRGLPFRRLRASAVAIAAAGSLWACATHSPTPPPTLGPTLQAIATPEQIALTPRFRAAGLGDLSTLSRVPDSEIDLPSANGTTLLMVAARRANLASVRYLLARHANPNATDVQKQTALYYAMDAKNIDIVRTLLAADADPSRTDIFGQTPIRWLIEERHYKIVLDSLRARQTWCCYRDIAPALAQDLEADDASANSDGERALRDQILKILRAK